MVVSNPVAERLLLSAFVQGVVDDVDLSLFTNDEVENRRVWASVMVLNGRPGSPEALGLWLQDVQCGAEGIEALFAGDAPENVDQVEEALRTLAVRRNCVLGADELEQISLNGYDRQFDTAIDVIDAGVTG